MEGSQIGLPEVTAFQQPFPAASKSTSGLVANRLTTVTSMSFADKILITVTQGGRLAHWVHVPLATATADPMNPGLLSSSEDSLLPMSHLTATTVLGGTKREDEVVGQTLATTIGSAILMKKQHEERLLVLGLGFEQASAGFTGRAQFDEVVGLVLEVL